MKTEFTSPFAGRAVLPGALLFLFACGGGGGGGDGGGGGTGPVTVESVTITTAPDEIFEDREDDLSALVKGSDGSVMNNVTVSWSSSDESVLTVASTGTQSAVVTSLTEGNAIITAEAQGKEGSAQIDVLRLPVLEVAEDTADVPALDTGPTLTVTLDGEPATGLRFEITSEAAHNEGLSVLDAAQLPNTLLATGAGAATVFVTTTESESTGDSVVVRVVPDAPYLFRIESEGEVGDGRPLAVSGWKLADLAANAFTFEDETLGFDASETGADITVPTLPSGQCAPGADDLEVTGADVLATDLRVYRERADALDLAIGEAIRLDEGDHPCLMLASAGEDRQYALAYFDSRFLDTVPEALDHLPLGRIRIEDFPELEIQVAELDGLDQEVANEPANGMTTLLQSGWTAGQENQGVMGDLGPQTAQEQEHWEALQRASQISAMEEICGGWGVDEPGCTGDDRWIWENMPDGVEEDEVFDLSVPTNDGWVVETFQVVQIEGIYVLAILEEEFDEVTEAFRTMSRSALEFLAHEAHPEMLASFELDESELTHLNGGGQEMIWLNLKEGCSIFATAGNFIKMHVCPEVEENPYLGVLVHEQTHMMQAAVRKHQNSGSSEFWASEGAADLLGGHYAMDHLGHQRGENIPIQLNSEFLGFLNGIVSGQNETRGEIEQGRHRAAVMLWDQARFLSRETGISIHDAIGWVAHQANWGRFGFWPRLEDRMPTSWSANRGVLDHSLIWATDDLTPSDVYQNEDWLDARSPAWSTVGSAESFGFTQFAGSTGHLYLAPGDQPATYEVTAPVGKMQWAVVRYR